MFKKVCLVLLVSFLTSCASIGSDKYEYVKVSGNVVKACNFITLGDARKQATIQYLEENGVSINSNNNTICNNLGCMQEDEIRLFSENTLEFKQIQYDVESNCRIFKAKKLKKKTSKEVDINHEGRFDISHESNVNVISINVANVNGLIWAKMNNKLKLINGEDIIVRGSNKTLEFEIFESGFEKKKFTIKLGKKPEKIIKNITLVRTSKEVMTQEDLGHGYKLIQKNGCRFFGLICNKRVDKITNTRPLDLKMLREKSLKGRDLYYLFNDMNLYRAMDIVVHSHVNKHSNLIVQAFGVENSKKEFGKTARHIASNYARDLVTSFDNPYNDGGDYGSFPTVEVVLYIYLYDKYGTFVAKRGVELPVSTYRFNPDFRGVKDNYSSKAVFHGYYMDEYELRYEVRLVRSGYRDKKYISYSGSYTGQSIHRCTSPIKRPPYTDEYRVMWKKYFPKQ